MEQGNSFDTRDHTHIHAYLQSSSFAAPAIVPPRLNFLFGLFPRLRRRPLPVSFGSIVAILDDQILRSVVKLPREVRLQDVLRPFGIPLLRIERGPRHVRHRSVASALGIGCVAERMLLGCWLGVPDVASVASEVARLEGFRHVFLDHNGTAGGVDKPGAWNDMSVTRMIRQAMENTLLHLGD